MSRSKPPRRKYRPRDIVNDPLAVALHRAAKPSRADRADVLAPLQRAIKALRQGQATEQHWILAAGAVAVAQAIERQGVVRGLAGHLQTAELTLQAIHDRALRIGHGRWLRVTLYFDELDALTTFEDLHTYQLNQLGRAEIIAALDAAARAVKADGHTVTLVHDTSTLNDHRMAA